MLIFLLFDTLDFVSFTKLISFIKCLPLNLQHSSLISYISAPTSYIRYLISYKLLIMRLLEKFLLNTKKENK